MTSFVKTKSKKDGVGSYCKPCHNRMATQWRNLNLEKRRAYDRDYVKQPWRRAQLTSNERRRRATKRDLPALPYDVTNILHRDNFTCSLCGLPVDPNNFHIEHTIPLQVDQSLLTLYGILEHPGDVPWNVSPSHPVCNTSKGNRMTQEDVARYLLWTYLYKE